MEKRIFKTVILFKISKEDDYEKAVFKTERKPNANEIQNYFEVACGGVFEWKYVK